MKNISDWLDEHVNDDVNLGDDATIEQQAEIIRAEAEAAGYSAEDLNKACEGDIAGYLKNRRGRPTGEDADGKMAGDASPIITPGFNQQ
ncbi:hypothetical protein [Rhizobium mesoamericanum]|uniref:DUF768 domain-containing protein n=1 Tax=Rhizobium mesoamericanum STM3625 TaxID=1211777 RepID=K0PXC7_9HYPH|nr:hypothetical protein [Rhizobium mesoamericanum]CCM76007.1 hypothetical protein BN77_3194 [Rhizobium mesoamericanum STM3625]